MAVLLWGHTLCQDELKSVSGAAQIHWINWNNFSLMYSEVCH